MHPLTAELFHEDAHRAVVRPVKDYSFDDDGGRPSFGRGGFTLIDVRGLTASWTPRLARTFMVFPRVGSLWPANIL
jgi:hypothetical protein